MKSVVVAVVLAAGASKRFRSDKLLAVLPSGERLIERALRAVADYATCVVVSPRLLEHVDTRAAAVVVNERPEFGMAHSLQLANERIDRDAALLVLPADLALIESRHVATVANVSEGHDVTYPQNATGVPGHPVIFSARARTFIAKLARGEPISRVRDRPDLARNILPIDEPWPYRDVDRESDIASL